MIVVSGGLTSPKDKSLKQQRGLQELPIVNPTKDGKRASTLQNKTIAKLRESFTVRRKLRKVPSCMGDGEWVRGYSEKYASMEMAQTRS